ncbi:MAG: BASS family bile acid:Na+ symporter [Paracoccaceae bacterium]|jgi:BASS family bile acid:Na+ symporter
MDLVTIGVPLALAFIMFSLGLGLTVSDFKRVLLRPVAFGIGAANQLLLLPIIAFALAHLFGLTGALAVGFMILAFSPGGVTSNVISRLAKADVALSVSLTAVISLLTIFTMPVLLAWSVTYFEGNAVNKIDITSIAISMALITALPTLIGLVLRASAPKFVLRIERGVSMTANILFVVIVVGAILANRELFLANLAILGPSVFTLCVVLLALGYFVAKGAGQTAHVAKTIGIETGIQNAGLAITVANLAGGYASGGFSEYALAPAVYGVVMYFGAAPFIFWWRRIQ